MTEHNLIDSFKYYVSLYSYLYISVSPYIYWFNGIRTTTITDHSYDVYNFDEAKSCNYEYEYKQWLSEYDNVEKKAGENIDESKGWGSGLLDPLDEDDNNWPDYHSSDSGFQSHNLADYHLIEGDWYEVGGYVDWIEDIALDVIPDGKLSIQWGQLKRSDP